ncbi:hypothetical protein RhiXN_10387 [Rhizoctonia solani]|uniref:HAT C-terminal dimerisation domain-containing protein n=1 Tax=Rhizoctonia solani TaxID=456999 RepID=A0A8H8P3N1_9AGAM|nr:uncharacterized protein RhiXN_10387 [Rhizoctonia solani]QRW24063.1 hypothetical protein RhiXN_10387 [Rhizoctonia solani]
MNSAVQTCVLNSLELRWGKSDQDPHIVSVILNPYIRLGVFHPQNALLNCLSLYGATKRVFRRLFRKDNDLEMHKAFMDYLDGKNEFHADRWDFQELRELYERSGKPVNLVCVWLGLLTSNTANVGRQQLMHLAINVLSIVANSAGCEQLFSEMGYIQSKRCSCLSNKKTFNTAVVQMELKRTHAAAGLTRACLHCQFGLSASKQLGEAALSLPDADKEDQHNETAEELAELDTSDKEAGTSGFKKLASKLAQDVLDDKDLPEDSLEVDNPNDVPLSGLKLATESEPRPRRVRFFFGTQYPVLLRDLFNYNVAHLEGQGLNIFRQAGLSNLQKELEAYDLLTRDMKSLVVKDDLAM